MSGLGRAILAPRSIALVGATNDPQKAASRPLEFLKANGYSGTVYPVNPRQTTVRSERSYPTLSDLPEVPEHVLVMTAAETAIDVVVECSKLGVPVATVLSNGFSEAGPEGVERERRLTAAAVTGGVRLVGPNSLGVVHLGNGLRLTGNAVFAERHLRAGGTFIASQSGSMIGALVSRGQAKGVGFGGVVSVGSEADLSIGEICDLVVADDGVTSFLLFLESIRHASRLAAFARRAVEFGKPVVAYKLGRCDVAAQLAVSHTGALAGEDDVASAFLAACGIARVRTLDGLLEASGVMAALPIRPAGARPFSVGVVSTTGGGAAMVVDELGVRSIEVAGPQPPTIERLAAAGVSAGHGAIVDLTLAGTRYDVMRPALDIMLDAPEYDMVIAVAGSSARLRPELAVAPIADAVSDGRLLAAFLVPDAPEAAARLGSAGVPTFTSPEVCADVVAAAAARRPPRTPAAPAHVESPVAGRSLDEASSYALLRAAGVDVAPHAVVAADATSFALPFDFPVAVKVLDDQIGHKTEVGGVVLGVVDDAGLRAAIATITANLATQRPERSVRYVLVQPMTGGIAQLLVGFRRDPQVGPIVVLAGGGVLTELYNDRAVRLAPVDNDTAREMLDEVVAVRQLHGFRGAAEGDLDAVVRAVRAMSTLAHDPHILEAEVNPLMVGPRDAGAVAIDALVVVSDEQA